MGFGGSTGADGGEWELGADHETSLATRHQHKKKRRNCNGCLIAAVKIKHSFCIDPVGHIE